MAKNEMLKSEGWTVTEVQGCPDCPLSRGATVLVGQKAGQKLQHSVALIDSTGFLRVGDATVTGAKLKASISVDKSKWALSGTRTKEGDKHKITGKVQRLLEGDRPSSDAGTWHAEGNGGGGGGLI